MLNLSGSLIELFYFLYIFSACFFLIIQCTSIRNKSTYIIPFVFFSSLSLGYVILFREFSGDALTYLYTFNHPDYLDGINVWGVGFIYYTKFLNIFENETIYLLSYPVSLFISGFYLSKKVNHHSSFTTFFFLFTLSTFFALYSVTGFRQSIAIVVCYLFVAMIMNRFWLISVLLILLAFNFHSTAIIFSLAIFSYVISLRILVLIYLISLIIGIVDISSAIDISSIEGIISNRYEAYFNTDYQGDYVTGIKPQFVGFSLYPFMYILYEKKYKCFEISISELFIIKSFFIINSIANIMSFIPYSDRVYAYSWALLPILVTSIFSRLSMGSRFCYISSMLLVFIFYNYSIYL